MALDTLNYPFLSSHIQGPTRGAPIVCGSRACLNLSPFLVAGRSCLPALSTQFSLILPLRSGHLKPMAELVDVPSYDGVGHGFS